MKYDRIYKQTNRDYYFIYLDNKVLLIFLLKTAVHLVSKQIHGTMYNPKYFKTLIPKQKIRKNNKDMLVYLPR